MRICCEACKTECIVEVAGPTLLDKALPKGWRPRRIDGRVYILCDVCGNIRQFVGGPSPYLRERLGVARNAVVETPEYGDLPADWFKSC